MFLDAFFEFKFEVYFHLPSCLSSSNHQRGTWLNAELSFWKPHNPREDLPSYCILVEKCLPKLLQTQVLLLDKSALQFLKVKKLI